MKPVEGLRKQNPQNGETAQTDTVVQYDGGLYVGGQGDVVIQGYDGNNFTLTDVLGFVPIDVQYIVSSGTTATSIVGLKK